MEIDNLILKLTTVPKEFNFSDRQDFVLSFSATNKDKVEYDPELHLTKLFINQKESFAWMYAIGNGKRESKWHSLPPNETTSLSWSTMGKQLFPDPGEYILQLQLKSIKSEPIKVIVNDD